MPKFTPAPPVKSLERLKTALTSRSKEHEVRVFGQLVYSLK
jgi:hypothetical protein